MVQNTFDRNQKNAKKKFSIFFSILSSLRPLFVGPQSLASSSDLFGQGKQFSEIFQVFLRLVGLNQKTYLVNASILVKFFKFFLRLEGLNQKILLIKKVLEFNFMVLENAKI